MDCHVAEEASGSGGGDFRTRVEYHSSAAAVGVESTELVHFETLSHTQR
jgi:hypothetical protein